MRKSKTLNNKWQQVERTGFSAKVDNNHGLSQIRRADEKNNFVRKVVRVALLVIFADWQAKLGVFLANQKEGI